MNIFFVDSNPVVAAQSLVDKHVVKMIVETVQLLSTAHRYLDGRQVQKKKMVAGSLPARWRNMKDWVLDDGREEILYKATHINHPSAAWCRESVENYNWLVEHFFALCDEYTRRYKRKHICSLGNLPYTIQSPPNNLKNYDWTTPPSVMDDKYIITENYIDNYRNYYKFGKANLHSWTNREPPLWIKED